jgi:hypothetical protein
MLTMIYMTRIQNMSFFLLKVNNPSVRHPVWPVGHSVWPRRAPVWPLVRHPVWPPSSTPSGPVWPSVLPPRLATRWEPRLAPRPAAVESKKKKKKKIFFLVVVAGWKRGQKIFQFSIPKIPKFPKFPELRGLRGQSREKKKVFLA